MGRGSSKPVNTGAADDGAGAGGAQAGGQDLPQILDPAVEGMTSQHTTLALCDEQWVLVTEFPVCSCAE